jgi:hypothetical protein
MRSWAMATISVLAFCTAIPSTQAMSFGGAANALRDVAPNNNIERIADRRCWWRQGVRYCRRFRTAPDSGTASSKSVSFGRSIGLILGIH